MAWIERRMTEVMIETIPRSRGKARTQFDLLSTELIHGWAERKRAEMSACVSSEPTVLWRESPNSWFKRNVYRFLKRHVDAARTDVFDAAILRSPHRRTFALDRVRNNPFKVGLFAMWAEAELARNDRKVFGDQMLYAHLHGVPPEHLLGFILSAGSPATIAKKLALDFCEPGFDRSPDANYATSSQGSCSTDQTTDCPPLAT